MSNQVEHPSHYNKCSIECIDVIDKMDFCTGSAIKYLWRHEYKDAPIVDLKKAIWLIERRIKVLKQEGIINENK